MSGKENVEQFLGRCPQVIYKAERLRAEGKRKRAWELVEDARLVSAKEISEFSDWQISNLMRAWRIDVVAHTSEAKRSLTGKRAVRQLRQARWVINNYYDEPQVVVKAKEFDHDTENHPYDFEVEMLRDRAKYCLAAATITGDASFRIAAVEFFNKALEKAREVTAAGLARMELGINTANFNKIKQGFGQTYAYSLALGNLDRARWAAKTYFGESLKRFQITESVRALKDLARVRKNPVKVAQDMIIGVVESSEILSVPLNFVRRKTLPKGFNSESLKIS